MQLDVSTLRCNAVLCLWARELTAPEIAEFAAALANVKPTGLKILDIKLNDFPL